MIRFSRFTWLYRLISVVVIGVGIWSITMFGFRISIDFQGGTDLAYKLQSPLSQSVIESILKKQGIQTIDLKNNATQLTIKSKAIDEKQEVLLRKAIEAESKKPVTLLSFETVGPVIGAETLRKTAFAAGVGVIGILLYVAYAFRNINFAFAAVIALVHDVLVVVGMYSLISRYFGAEVDTLFVTALLTTMSFSVHDTIVVFDQIREYQKRYGEGDMTEYADKALTDTMVRSFNNSMTIIFMLLALVLLGGETIRYFAITLLIGTITGTYSSPFVATPTAVWLDKLRKK